jgi:hypothetical protein
MIRYQKTARHFLPVLGHFFLPSRFEICLLLAVTELFLTFDPRPVDPEIETLVQKQARIAGNRSGVWKRSTRT